jgi:hypothetical protein
LAPDKVSVLLGQGSKVVVRTVKASRIGHRRDQALIIEAILSEDV